MTGTPGPAGLLDVPAGQARRRWQQRAALNWRLLLARVLVSGLAVMITVLAVPGLAFTSWRPGQLLLVAAVYTALTAVVRPVLEFLALRFLVATFGLVVVVINATLLLLLALLLPDLLTYDRWWPLVLGGFVVGIVGAGLETVLGVSPPVFDTAAPRPHGDAR